MAETVGQHSVAAFTSPVNGTSPIDANTVKGNDNTIRSAYVDHDADPGIHVQSSTLASRPVANSAGRKWMTQDSGVIRLFYDDGTSWYEIDYLRTTGGTISGNLAITGTLSVTGVATLTAQPILSSLTASQAVFTDASKGLVSNAITGTGNVVMSASPTLTGTITAAAATLSGALGVSGLLTFASLKGTGATTVTNILDEDNMASDSATALATQQSIKAYVDAQVGASDALSEVLAIGNTTGANDIIVSAGQKIRTPAVAAQDGSSAITIANTTGALTLATALADSNLATISTAGKVANSATTATDANTASAIVARDSSGNFSAGTITAALSGNASTATALQTARTINGVSFDGTANITVTADAGTLTGSTLASGVTASSLTSVGTLTGLTVSGASPLFNTGDALGTLTLGTTAAVTQEQRFRLTNSVATGGVELILNGAATLWGLYDRTASKWALQITRGATDAVSIPGYAAVGGAVSANSQLYVRGTMVGSGTNQYAALVQTTFPVAATSGMHGVFVATTGAAGTYTTTNVIGVNAQPHTLGAGQTVTNAYGVLIGASSHAATTKYGIQIGSVTGGTTNYALYTETGQVRFGDNVRVVNGSLSISTAPNSSATAIQVGTDHALLTSSTSYGMLMQPTAQGTVTNLRAIEARVVISATTALAAAFGAYIRTPTIASGGTIATNYGLHIDGQTGATTNYAIYTNAGLVRFGDAVSALSSLTVSGDLTVDTNTLKVDSTNNRVGIGTATPGYTLDSVSGDGNLFRFDRSGVQIGAFVSATNPFFGTLSNSPLLFMTNSTERMRLDASGRLGIGTANPATGLHLLGVASANTDFTHETVSAGTAARTRYLRGGSVKFLAGLGAYTGGDTYEIAGPSAAFATIDASGNLGLGVTPPAGSGNIYIAAGKYLGYSASAYMTPEDNVQGARIKTPGGIVFEAGGTERARIDTSGNLLVGATANPGILNRSVVIDSGSSSLAGYILQNDTTGRTSTDGSALYISGSSLNLYNLENSPMVFGTNNTERARITSGGELFIGATAASGASRLVVAGSGASGRLAKFLGDTAGDLSNASVLFSKFDNNSTTSQVFLQFAINNDATANGQINANGSGAVAFGSWSDARLKTNVVDLSSQWDNVKGLRPVEFDYIEEVGGGHQIGFIAQEVREIYPDVVGERADGMLTLSGMSKNEARLIKALQEAMARIESLEARLAALEN